MKSIPFIIAFCLFGLCNTPEKSQNNINTETSDYSFVTEQYQERLLPPIEKLGSGNYLSSRFAQQNHDWKMANIFIENLMGSGKIDTEITRQAMILAMGAGDTEKAMGLAAKIEPKDPSYAIAQIFLITNDIAKENSASAEKRINSLPKDITSNYIKPFLTGWNSALAKKLDIKNLKDNTVQLYHAILISDFLNDHSQLEALLKRNIIKNGVNQADIERIADLYAHAGMKTAALELYNEVKKEWPNNADIDKKIKEVKSGTNKPLFAKVKSAKYGMAVAYSDIARVLFQDYNDESARIFANLSLTIDPDMIENKLLLAEINARHNQQDEAIAFYNSIPESDQSYTNAQFKIAELLENKGKKDESLQVLNNLADRNNTIEVQISVGDFHRRQENYEQAIKLYDSALKKLGGKAPPEYWGIHYARGVCFEQLGNWEKAEIELKSALELQPDHPHVLNYLGYGWAEKGIHLEEALSLINKAVTLRPDDGYIVDSLGWAQFRMGNYNDAVPNLERAVELLPYDPTINDHLGDAYWMANRQREARFQWMRAKNYSKNEKQINELTTKLVSGIAPEKNHMLGENKHQ